MHKSWEDNVSKDEEWAKINTDRKRSLYIEKDCFEKLQNYCSTGDRAAELNIHLEDSVLPQKVSNMSFTNPTSTVGLQLLNLGLLKVMLICLNDAVMAIKPGHQTPGNT
jgi:hypothetical protein